MTNYPLFPPQNEDVVGFARTWWHNRQAVAGNGVLIDSNDPNGMKVTRASASSVNVAAGHYANKGVWKAYAGASPAIESIPAASEGYHRYDSICVKLSDNTIVRVAGTEAVPDIAANFLENFTPLPSDLNSTDYIELAVICVDENGIRSTDNGTYSVGGVCDTRPPFVFGLDDSTLKISADGKLEVQSLYPLLSILTTRGDMIRRSSTTWERFAAGAENTVLAMGANDPAWSTVSALLDSVVGSTANTIATRGAETWGSLTPGEQTVVGRITGGSLAALSVAQLKTLLFPDGKYRLADIPAGGWHVPDTNGAELETDTGTNGNMQRYLFDDTTEEFIEYVLEMPHDLDTDGTVTFEVRGYAAAAAADKYIQLKVSHSAKATNESWDAAYSSKMSGDTAISGTQDQLNFTTWTETVSNLGWAASDQVRIKLSRIDTSAETDLPGDYGVTHVRIKIPVVV